MQIKAGDTVQCIDSTNCNGLVEGQVYKVTGVQKDNIREYVLIEGRDLFLAAARFQKVKPVKE